MTDEERDKELQKLLPILGGDKYAHGIEDLWLWKYDMQHTFQNNTKHKQGKECTCSIQQTTSCILESLRDRG